MRHNSENTIEQNEHVISSGSVERERGRTKSDISELIDEQTAVVKVPHSRKRARGGGDDHSARADENVEHIQIKHEWTLHVSRW